MVSQITTVVIFRSQQISYISFEIKCVVHDYVSMSCEFSEAEYTSVRVIAIEHPISYVFRVCTHHKSNDDIQRFYMKYVDLYVGNCITSCKKLCILGYT